jgi:hypothetical protein
LDWLPFPSVVDAIADTWADAVWGTLLFCFGILPIRRAHSWNVTGCARSLSLRLRHRDCRFSWFTSQQTNKVETLIEESLNPTTPHDPQPPMPLNGAVMLFLQQHTGWTDDRVTQVRRAPYFPRSLHRAVHNLCYPSAEADMSTDEFWG